MASPERCSSAALIDASPEIDGLTMLASNLLGVGIVVLPVEEATPPHSVRELRVEGDLVGALCSPDAQTRVWTASEHDVLSGVASAIEANLSLRRKHQTLQAKHSLVIEQSLTDNLTGLNNRRGFSVLAEQALKGAQRDGLALLLFFIDMDGMKEINDRFGHDMGDRALHDTAALLRSTFREVDVVARLGGDEFVVLATHAPEHSATTLTERLETRLAEHNQLANRLFELSLSVGTAPYDPANPVSVEQLLTEADLAMYRQKRRRGVARSSAGPLEPQL